MTLVYISQRYSWFQGQLRPANGNRRHPWPLKHVANATPRLRPRLVLTCRHPRHRAPAEKTPKLHDPVQARLPQQGRGLARPARRRPRDDVAERDRGGGRQGIGPQSARRRGQRRGRDVAASASGAAADDHSPLACEAWRAAANCSSACSISARETRNSSLASSRSPLEAQNRASSAFTCRTRSSSSFVIRQ